MEKEKSIRDYYHLIQNELNVLSNACGNVEVMAKKLKADSNPEELKDFLLLKMQEIKDSSKTVCDAIAKIKIPNYMLIDVDISLGELDEQIKEKYKNITVHIVEGDPSLCKWYEEVLGKWGFQIGFSHSFGEVETYFQKGNIPYILILDAQDSHPMKSDKVLNVEDVLKIIEKHSRGTQVVVASSGIDQQFLQRMGNFKGVVRSIPKPVTAIALEAALTVALLKTIR